MSMMIQSWDRSGYQYLTSPSTDLPLVVPSGVAPMASYEGGKITRAMSNWRPANRSHDALARENWDLLLARGRWLGRNNPWCRGAKGVFVSNILGEGARTRSVVRRADGTIEKEWCQAADDLYRRWSDYAHVHYQWSLNEMLAVNLASTIESGTGFLLEVANPDPQSPVPIAFQPFEIDQLDMTKDRPARSGGEGPAPDNEIRNGVEREPSGKVVAYHLFTEHPGDGYRFGSWRSQRFPADRVICLFAAERVVQHIGTTWFAPIIQPLWDSYEYMKHEISAAKIASYFIGMEKRADWGGDGGGLMADEDAVDENGNRLLNLAPQLLLKGGPQDSLEVIRSDRPNSSAVGWLRFMLQMMAAGLNMTMIRFTGDFSQTNFSSSRAADLQDRKTFRPQQKWHAWHVDLEIRRRVIDRAITLGILPIAAGGVTRYLRDRERWLSAIAQLPGWGYVDPEKQVAASIAAIQGGLSTWERELADLGLDYEEIFEQQAEERRLLEQLKLPFGTTQPSAGANYRPGGNMQPKADDPVPADQEESDA